MDAVALIHTARGLLAGHTRGDNPEYERALVELTTAALGLSQEADGPAVADLLLGRVPARRRAGVLDAEVLRDDWVDRPGLSASQKAALEALSDESLEAAMQACINADRDYFYGVLDGVRGDATRLLLREHGLGDEGD